MPRAVRQPLSTRDGGDLLPVGVDEVERQQLLINGLQQRAEDDEVVLLRVVRRAAEMGREMAKDPDVGDPALFVVRSVGERVGVRVEALGDALWALMTNEHVFFVDSLNTRFWLLHTTAPGNAVRRLVRRELLTDARIDTAWLPSDQLDQFEGRRHWVKSSFTSDELLPVTGEAAGPTRRWRVQVEGDAPEELLNLVRTDPRFASAASLTAVGSSLAEAGIGEASVIADYRGGFVASGTSFELVAGALWRTLDRYENYVRGLEATHQLRAERVGELGLTIDGEVAVIDFPQPLADLERFVAGLFTSKEPFRFWAVPRKVDEEEWEANAVDLHVGQTLRLEITPRWMRCCLASTVAATRSHASSRICSIGSMLRRGLLRRLLL